MRRRYLWWALGAFLVALLAVWRFGYHGVDPRLIVWPPPAPTPPPAALDELAESSVAHIAEMMEQVLKFVAHNRDKKRDSALVQRPGLAGR